METGTRVNAPLDQYSFFNDGFLSQRLILND